MPVTQVDPPVQLFVRIAFPGRRAGIHHLLRWTGVGWVDVAGICLIGGNGSIAVSFCIRMAEDSPYPPEGAGALRPCPHRHPGKGTVMLAFHAMRSCAPGGETLETIEEVRDLSRQGLLSRTVAAGT